MRISVFCVMFYGHNARATGITERQADIGEGEKLSG